MTNPTRELISMHAINQLFMLLAWLLPLIGLVIGAGIGTARKRIRFYAGIGLLIGFIGPLNWLLWRFYNGITNRMGLDTVRNLIVNLLIFAGIGLLGGLIGGVIGRKLTGQSRSRVIQKENDSKQ